MEIFVFRLLIDSVWFIATGSIVMNSVSHFTNSIHSINTHFIKGVMLINIVLLSPREKQMVGSLYELIYVYIDSVTQGVWFVNVVL